MNAKSNVRVNGKLGEEFDVSVGVHHGSLFSSFCSLWSWEPDLKSRDFKSGLPWEMLYADDLVSNAESLEKLTEEFEPLRSGMNLKGLRMNMGKTKVMISSIGAGPVFKSGKYPCGVCQEGVGTNDDDDDDKRRKAVDFHIQIRHSHTQVFC